MQAPEPVAILTERGLRIFHRVYQLSLDQGTWHPICEPSLGVLASVCDRYLEAAEKDPSSPDTEELRDLARKYMSDFMLIEEKYTAIGEVDGAGVDVQVLSLCT